MDLPIPSKLLEEQSSLVPPDEHRVSYKPNVWRRRFPADKDLEDLFQRFPHEIARKQIANLAGHVNEGGETPRKLFMATMLWGYGTVGYGAYRTSIMLSDSSSTDVVNRSYELVCAGNYVKAYEMFYLPMCGSAFFTKYFYFVGLGNRVEPLPLIFDSVVANSLINLGIDVSAFAHVVKNPSGRVTSIGKYLDGYSKYVEVMSSWAKKLECRADAIEKWLFG
jgi:hypothetical protein